MSVTYHSSLFIIFSSQKAYLHVHIVPTPTSYPSHKSKSSTQKKKSYLMASFSESSSTTNPDSEIIEATVQAFGFEFTEVSPNKVAGRLLLTRICCQPFKVMHGGVSALIAESLASVGAHLASGLQRVAGVQLSINHIKSAKLGEVVFAEAAPINVGRKVQVWEVKIWKNGDGGDSDSKMVVSTSRVTLLTMSVPEHAKDAGEHLKKYAKL